MIKVMFVCLGNICRSPMAEAIFRHVLQQRGLDKKISCDSSGTSNWHVGDLPDPRTIEIAIDNGIKIDHKGRQFGTQDFKDYQYIIAMDSDNLGEINILNKSGPGNAEIFMMREFDNNKSGNDVPDPYYGDRGDFQYVFDILNECCNNLADFLVKRNHAGK